MQLVAEAEEIDLPRGARAYCDTRASALRPVSALMRLDLPTFERPTNATSGSVDFGIASMFAAPATNSQVPANNFRPSMPGPRRPARTSVRTATGSGTSTALIPDIRAWPRRRTDGGRDARVPGFRCLLAGWVRAPEKPRRFRKADAFRLLKRCTSTPWRRIITYCWAVGEQVVPGPVDHKPGGKARQHEGENERHEGEHARLHGIGGRRIHLRLQPLRHAHQDRPDADVQERQESQSAGMP